MNLTNPVVLGAFVGEVITSIKEQKGSAVKVRSNNPAVEKLSVTIPNEKNTKTTMFLEIQKNREAAEQLFIIGTKLGFPVRVKDPQIYGLTSSQQHILVAK